jgi:nucleoside-diphosphate-sugar epimerase
MRILIVGGTSSLAQALKPVLSEFAEVVTAGRSGCDIHMDLSDPIEKIEIPQHIDVVINNAVHFGGIDYGQMYMAENVNVLGPLKLCQASLKAKVKHFISISSIFACLDATSDYFGIYALSKKQSDEVIELFCSLVNLPYTILRPSQIYGDEDIFKKRQPFLYMTIDKAARSEDITIYGVHDALRNYIHINDLTKIISMVVTKQVQGLYACTNAVDVSFSQIANAAINAFSSSSKVVFLKEMKSIKDNVFAYNDSLYKKINCFPQISIEEGMKRIANYRVSKL